MRRTLLLVAAAGLLLAAVPATASGASSARPPLRGTNWVLTDRASIGVPLGDVAVNAVFAAGHVSGTSGCNGFSASFETSGTDRITIGPIASTLRGCDSSDQEQQYFAALDLAKTYQVTGNQLTLFRDGGTIAVTATRAPK